ncbi:MAG: lysostaphin resistance A-like protein, partial [Luteolibacter sp.]
FEMPDPTASIIIATFSLAIGIFVISSLIRKLIAAPQATDFPESGENSPYPENLPPHSQAGKVATGFYRPLDLLGLGFVFLLFFTLALASARSTGEEELVLSPEALLASIAFQFICAGIVTYFVIGRIHPADWLGLKWPAWPWIFLIAPGMVLLMWSLIGGLQVAGLMNWIESMGVEVVQDTVKLLQESEDPLILGLMAFAAVIAAPLCEEIVFRGYFYPVAKKFAGPWAAALCSALVFGAAHGNLMALIPLTVFGILLAFLYEKTGSIWAPIAVHFCFNGATVLTQMLARYYDIPLETTP